MATEPCDPNVDACRHILYLSICRARQHSESGLVCSLVARAHRAFLDAERR